FLLWRSRGSGHSSPGAHASAWDWYHGNQGSGLCPKAVIYVRHQLSKAVICAVACAVVLVGCCWLLLLLVFLLLVVFLLLLLLLLLFLLLLRPRIPPVPISGPGTF
ncbi:unnamed protein product, partial [Polarella glacialis]